MSTLPLPLSHDPPASRPLATGIALSVTVSVFYALCTAVCVVAPGLFMSFMSSLSHGMDFTVLLEPGSFVKALLVMAVWSFLTGTFYGWLRQRLAD